MYKIIKSYIFQSASALLLLTAVGCKKGTFDINDTNPNVPSTVAPQYVLSSSLASTATLVSGNPGGGSISGNDLFNMYMGYWAVSGDYIPNASLVQYTLTTDFGASIWDNTYPTIQNLKSIEGYYAGSPAKGANYIAIAKITKSLLFQRLVDIYNNIPYTQAAAGGTIATPVYDDAKTVYTSLVNQLDSAVALIKSASASADNPANYDIMFGGNMPQWISFANTLKLKILLRQTQMSGSSAYITSKLAGLTTADFIGSNADAMINPGYNNGATNRQNPLWQDLGWNPTGALQGLSSYFRANSYAVNFYTNTNDPRLSLVYALNSSGAVKGRAFGSTKLEHNTDISAIGGNSTGAPQSIGLLKSYSQGSVILSSTESLFLQAEAVQRGFLSGSANVLYQSAVAESFRLLGVAGYTAAAATYTAQSGDVVNFTNSVNPIKTIITQKWAALNTYDPLESWSDWRRLGIPSDLPISTYPGTTATHIPYRLLYPTSEYNYNTANVNAQGTIDALSSKIFWMP